MSIVFRSRLAMKKGLVKKTIYNGFTTYIVIKVPRFFLKHAAKCKISCHRIEVQRLVPPFMIPLSFLLESYHEGVQLLFTTHLSTHI